VTSKVQANVQISSSEQQNKAEEVSNNYLLSKLPRGQVKGDLPPPAVWESSHMTLMAFLEQWTTDKPPGIRVTVTISFFFQICN